MKAAPGFRERLYKKWRLLLQTIRLVGEVWRDFHKRGVSRKQFLRSLLFGAVGRMLTIVQLGLLYKVLHALIVGERESILNGRLGRVFSNLLPGWVQDSFWLWIFIIAGVLFAKVLQIALSYQAERYLFETTKRIQTELNNEIFERVLRFSLSFFDQRSSKAMNHWMDVSQLLTLKTGIYAEQIKNVHTFLMSAVTIGVFLLAICIFNWKIFLLTLLVIPFTRFVSAKVMGGIEDILDEQEEENQRRFVNMTNILEASALVRCHNMEAREIARFQEINRNALDSLYSSSRLHLLETPVNGISKTLSTILLASTIPFSRIAAAPQNLSGTMLSLLALQNIEGSIDAIIRIMKSVHRYPAVKKEIEAICGPSSNLLLMKEGPHKIDRFKTCVELRGLNFDYLPGVPTLRDVHLSLPKGGSTAIVGQTGSGKSTIAKVLLRLYNIPNSVYFIDGRDATTCTLESVRELFGYVSQESVWLQQSIRQNLIYGIDRSISDEEILEVCQQVGVYAAIRKLPGKLDAMMDGHGSGFSTGERQCLSLARALLKRSEILILDEPTSALDAIAESRVQEIFEKLAGDRTLIVIAHRLSTIARADEVILLKEGRVAESGSVNSLLKQKEMFYDMWQKQGSFWL